MDKTFFYSVANFAVFAGLFGYALKKPVKQFVTSRHETIKEEVSSVREQLRQAQERYEEFSAKLKAVDVEVINIREGSLRDASAMKARLVSSAKQNAGTTLVEAKARASTLVSEIRDVLRAELGVRIVNRAQELIRERLTGDDRARIRREFSQRVGSTS
jgi:F-type H+-transporting ATPase subunit b